MKGRFVQALIAFTLMSAHSLWACDFSNPHSLSCQNETFAGKIFPLMPINFSLLDERWVPAQFTAGTRNSPFITVSSRSRRHRTCAVLNQDKSRVGVMSFRFTRNQIKSARITQFGSRGRNFKSRSRISFENAHTIIFGAGVEAFRCRIFLRAQTPHLSCQYFVNKQFVGYLGMLPHQISCQ